MEEIENMLEKIRSCSLEKLINTQGNEPIGKPVIIKMSAKLQLGNREHDYEFTKQLEEQMPEGATGFVKGDPKYTGRFGDALVNCSSQVIPVQYYRKITVRR